MPGTQALEGPKGILNIGKDIFGVAEEAAGQATSFANEHALSRFGVELPQMREGSMASLASGGQNRQGVEGWWMRCLMIKDPRQGTLSVRCRSWRTARRWMLSIKAG